MNSKLTILANGKPLTLEDDFSISIELANPLFNENEMFSYPVEIPLDGNRHVLKNIDDPNSDLRPVSFEHMSMQVYADGLPFASGTAVIGDDDALESALSLNIEAADQTFDDLISDLQCNEVEIPSRYHDQLLIGEKIDNVDVEVRYSTTVTVKYSGKKSDKEYGSVGSDFRTTATISPQALGFSYPAKCKEEGSLHKAVIKETRSYPDDKELNIPEVEESYINVTDAYPTKPFCNARVCYKHYALSEDGTTSSDVVQVAEETDPAKMYEDYGPVWVLEADRPQSGICFYVLFFLDCLFESLGVSFDKSALMEIGDLQRLVFFTTKCEYDTEPLYYGSLYDESDPEVIAGTKTTKDIKQGFFNKAVSGSDLDDLFDDVNDWLDSRGCGGKLVLENPKTKSVDQISYYTVEYEVVEEEDSRFHLKSYKSRKLVRKESETPITRTVGEDGIASITTKSSINSAQMSASVVRMYANGKNFPEESVATVISALENQFGIKFYYDYEQKKVTAYLLRDVFRKQNNAPRPFHANIHSIVQMSEKITGVKVGYSAEDDKTEQYRNITNQVKDYDTDYNYIDYPKAKTITSLSYAEIISQITNTNENVYIDMNTGNKYRVKIDSDYSSVADMNARLFEVGAYKSVEYGDCSTINEDFVQEYLSDFTPVGMIDVNYRKALAARGTSQGECVSNLEVQPTETGVYEGYLMGINTTNQENIYAALVDEDMEHEFVKQKVQNALSSTVADFYVTEELRLVESYDPSGTDDGNSPLQSYDWGLSIAIMRGGGVDSSTETYATDYDGFGNSKWRTISGKYAVTTDSIDCYGNVYDYNGTWEGIGNEERFSLKPRAWVQPEWASSPLINADKSVKDRGYFDVFMIDMAYFLLNRKKYRVQCTASVAQIADIQNHWREWWTIDGKKCLINRVTASLTATDGLGEVELEVYSM